jgi:uncharacterized YkwD family protein
VKRNYIQLGILFLIITFFVIPGFDAADNKGFQKYLFKDGTFYKYTVYTVDDYFKIPIDIDKSSLANVDWKHLNQKVLALKEEKEFYKDELENIVQQPQKTKDSVKGQQNAEKPAERESKNKSQNQKEIVDQATFEKEVVRLTNIEREKQGLTPLKVDAKLTEVAQKKSQDMAVNGYFSHDSPTYGSPFDMMNDFGITYYSAGENIAKGQTSPSEVVQAWMDSEGHRENILHPDFTHIGVGFSSNGYYWAQQFIKRLEETVSQQDFEKKVVQLTNQARANLGLSPLSIDVELTKTARAKSLDMAEHDYFDHTSPTHGSPFEMMDQAGIAYQTAGENIARGQFTPEEVVEAWMNSEGHRANILNPNFTHIGVGFIKEDIIWTQQFIGK